MRGRPTAIFGGLLILVGVVYFLNQSHLASNWLTGAALWPLLLVILGLASLRNIRRRIPWWSMYLITLGGLLALRNTGTLPWLLRIHAWPLFFAVSLVFFGLSLLFPKRWWRFLRGKDPRWKDSHRNWELVLSGNKKHRDRDMKYSRTMGELSVGASPWVLSDINLWNAIGEIRLNLATADVEPGEYHISVGGLVGNIRILVPEDLAVDVEARLRLGQTVLFGHEQGGFPQPMHHQDPGFQDAAKKVYLDVEMSVGQIEVVRV